MPDDDDGVRHWIVEPPAPGDISLRLALGDGAHLTAEQETALVALVQSLEADDAEVTGHSPTGCGNHSRCPELMCEPLCEQVRCNLSNVGQSWNVMGTFGSTPA
jgi:hypothetical protein